MSADSSSQAVPTGLRAAPKAMWFALGALGIVTTGLAAALVMRSPDHTATAPVGAPLAPALATPAPDDGTPPVPKAKPQQPPSHAQARVGPTPRHAATQPPTPVAQRSHAAAAQVAICATCGTVESVQAVEQKGEGTGLGGIGGAVAGGLLGHQVGGGNGKTAMTVVGAVGGAFAGNEIEKRARSTTVYDVQVRMEDGSVRSFRRSEPIAAGTKVQAEGTTLRVSGGNAARASSGG